MFRLPFRSVSAFTAVCLCLWLMPLGAFIKPAQEKLACGGKRAFHMCCAMSGKAPAKAAGTGLSAPGSQTDRGAKASASGSDDFLPLEMRVRERRSYSRVYSPAVLPGYACFQSLRTPPPDRALFL
jgi:hypothetical protein